MTWQHVYTQVHDTRNKVQRGKNYGFLRLSLSTISVLFVPLLRHAIARLLMMLQLSRSDVRGVLC